MLLQAREDYLRRYDMRLEYDSTYTTVLGLHFDVGPAHFHGNSMVLKCTSSLLSVYWQSSEVMKNMLCMMLILNQLLIDDALLNMSADNPTASVPFSYLNPIIHSGPRETAIPTPESHPGRGKRGFPRTLLPNAVKQ